MDRKSEHDALSEWVGKQVTQKCPNGHPFVVRQNRENDSFFLGCSRYPACRETDEISVSTRLRLMGAKQLPGMEG